MRAATSPQLTDLRNPAGFLFRIARNLLVDEGGRVYVIDLDRCQLHDEAPADARWRENNLSRLGRSLARFTPTHHAACLAAIRSAYHA